MIGAPPSHQPSSSGSTRLSVRWTPHPSASSRTASKRRSAEDLVHLAIELVGGALVEEQLQRSHPQRRGARRRERQHDVHRDAAELGQRRQPSQQRDDLVIGPEVPRPARVLVERDVPHRAPGQMLRRRGDHAAPPRVEPRDHQQPRSTSRRYVTAWTAPSHALESPRSRNSRCRDARVSVPRASAHDSMISSPQRLCPICIRWSASTRRSASESPVEAAIRSSSAHATSSTSLQHTSSPVPLRSRRQRPRVSASPLASPPRPRLRVSARSRSRLRVSASPPRSRSRLHVCAALALAVSASAPRSRSRSRLHVLRRPRRSRLHAGRVRLPPRVRAPSPKPYVPLRSRSRGRASAPRPVSRVACLR